MTIYIQGIFSAETAEVRDNLETILEKLQQSIDKEQKETSSSKNVVEVLLQKIEEIYQEQIDKLMLQIEGFRNQRQLVTDKHNAIIAMNRTAKSVMEVFDHILNKDLLNKIDVDFIVDRITVYTNYIDIKLKPYINKILRNI